MPDNNTSNLKAFFKEFGYYLVNFFMSIIIGLGISILLDIPMKFIKTINIDLGHFIAYFLGMCIALYTRSYQQGYHQNTRTYTFQFKKTLLYVGTVFAVQIALIFIIGGHAVYISGPTYWLASYVLPAADRATIEGRSMIAGYDWLFMILADVLIYAPIMILGEYLGAKRNVEEVAQESQK